MKLKNVFEILGLRARPKRYGYQIESHVADRGVPVSYARWLHPKASSPPWTPAVFGHYREFISEGDFCIDIGAHTGDSTLPIALAAGKTGLTLALEPNPYVFPVLEKNARLNRGAANIVPMMAAATREQGFISFEYSDSGFCNGGRHENISRLRHGHAFDLPVWGVDLVAELKSDFKEALPKLTFIKTDAEGYDLFVLQSLREIIDAHRPFVKAEVFAKSDRAYREEMVRYFSQRNYGVYKVLAEDHLRGEPVTEADVMKWDHYDIFCVPNRF